MKKTLLLSIVAASVAVSSANAQTSVETLPDVIKWVDGKKVIYRKTIRKTTIDKNLKVSAPASDTTVSGKAMTYYMTMDEDGMFNKKNSNLASAVTLDVSHTIMEGLTANFSAVGFQNYPNKIAKIDLEGQKDGAFFNVANITANYFDTKVIIGRQLLDTPMLGGYDWLLAPGSFEAATIVNNSIDGLTLVGSFVNKWRANNSGITFTTGNTTDSDLDGGNFAVGANFKQFGANVSAWYYEVDAADYKQAYTDMGYDLGLANVAVQYAYTNTGGSFQDTSHAYAAKIGTNIEGVELMAAASFETGQMAKSIGRDTFYTNSWNAQMTNSPMDVSSDGTPADTLSWKVGASTEVMGLNTEVSYAMYGSDGYEADVILGYGITDRINVGTVFSSNLANIKETPANKATTATDINNILEIFATYTF